MTAASITNSLRTVAAVGGSTNAIVHLAAIAGRLAVPFDLTGAVDAVLRSVPLIADIEPSGRGLAGDFDAAGALPSVVAALGDLFDAGQLTADGRTWAEVAGDGDRRDAYVRDATDPVLPAPIMAVVRGSLAPDGAVVKVSAATPALLRHSGPAFVLDNYARMRQAMDDPDLELPDDVVLVIRDCGPIGGPGMPEWGMAPVPLALRRRGITDVVRVSDGRMSGTSFGTVVLHVAPESAVGGPLALVQDGDIISLDVEAGRLDLEVSPGELADRAARWIPPAHAHLRGWPRLFVDHVQQAPQGCDFDFLAAPTAEYRRFQPPVIGRS